MAGKALINIFCEIRAPTRDSVIPNAATGQVAKGTHGVNAEYPASADGGQAVSISAPFPRPSTLNHAAKGAEAFSVEHPAGAGVKALIKTSPTKNYPQNKNLNSEPKPAWQVAKRAEGFDPEHPACADGGEGADRPRF